MSTVTDYWADRHISSNFGDDRGGGRKHRGTDFSHGNGTPIPSPLSGTVVGTLAPATWHGFGYQVTIKASSGETYSFAHMQGGSLYGVGSSVSVGDVLGYEGRTGATTGPCTHVEYNNGGFSNPAPHIAQLLAGGSVSTGGGSVPGFSQDTKNRQTWLISIGIGVGASGADGLEGDATKAAYKVYQQDLKNNWGYAGEIDGVWGSGTQAAHQIKYDSTRAPAPVAASQYHTATPADIASLGDSRGIQKVAKLNGYAGELDNQFGSNSQAGLQNFLNRAYGGSLAAWLRAKWGYSGNDQWGPVMSAAAVRANNANWTAL